MKPAIEVCGMMKKRLSGGMIKCKIRAKGRKRRLKNGRPQGIHKRRKVTARQKEAGIQVYNNLKTNEGEAEIYEVANKELELRKMLEKQR